MRTKHFRDGELRKLLERAGFDEVVAVRRAWLGLGLGLGFLRVKITSLWCAARTWIDVHVRRCMARGYPDPDSHPDPHPDPY